MLEIKIAPSILSSDFGKLNEEIAEVEPFVDLIHVDVMDGHFVPNLTIGPAVVKSIKSNLPLDIHLMIENPEKYVEAFVEAVKKSGNEHAPIIGVQVEACEDLGATIRQIKELGAKVEIVYNPETPLDGIEEYLSDVDQVLLMTVHPGFGGQSFIEDVIPKIRKLREMAPNLDIEVDGGINAETIKLARDAGANVFVAGSYIFGAEDRVAAIESLRL
ncbi:MAG: ribulose-phosphate 3-epimerase [Candidatus Peregrinibacteria bacterium]|nr:ribulose-phosphate 3-epimerase [Candidatus Peregrinibacteria bacterium]MDZ4245281.1 ribulose-phosphate 3-epimerase [Candidatus Gracilibacteria bacterium]